MNQSFLKVLSLRGQVGLRVSKICQDKNIHPIPIKLNSILLLCNTITRETNWSSSLLYSRRESNSYLSFRRATFYPLNYESRDIAKKWQNESDCEDSYSFAKSKILVTKIGCAHVHNLFLLLVGGRIILPMLLQCSCRWHL